jgi:hypothetical protein
MKRIRYWMHLHRMIRIREAILAPSLLQSFVGDLLYLLVLS